MSEAQADGRERIWPTYIVLGVVFVGLVVTGIVTVALPELADDPERAPVSGTPAAPASPAPTPPASAR